MAYRARPQRWYLSMKPATPKQPAASHTESGMVRNVLVARV